MTRRHAVRAAVTAVGLSAAGAMFATALIWRAIAEAAGRQA